MVAETLLEPKSAGYYHLVVIDEVLSKTLGTFRFKVDSHILRYDAARHEAVRQDAAKTHGCCSHMQRLPL